MRLDDVNHKIVVFDLHLDILWEGVVREALQVRTERDCEIQTPRLNFVLQFYPYFILSSSL